MLPEHHARLVLTRHVHGKGVEHLYGIAPIHDAEKRYGVWPVHLDSKGPHVRQVIDHDAAKALAALLSRDHFELVAGERRCRAAKLAGLTHVPALVRDLDDKAAAEITVIENDQREDVPPLGWSRPTGTGGWSSSGTTPRRSPPRSAARRST